MLSSLIISLAAISSLHSRAAIEDYIVYRAMDNGASVSLALGIAKSESGLALNAKNSSSTASGVAQFLDGTFKYLCINKYQLTDSMNYKNDPYVQIECLTRRLAEPNGVKDWGASRPAWQKLYSQE